MADAVTEMGDANQRRANAIIEADLGVAFPAGLAGSSGAKSRWPIRQKGNRHGDSPGETPGVGHGNYGRYARTGAIANAGLF